MKKTLLNGSVEICDDYDDAQILSIYSDFIGWPELLICKSYRKKATYKISANCGILGYAHMCYG